METVLLIILLLLALALIGVVLLQRSEGGGLGIGGGGGGIGAGRSAATGVQKLTWILGGTFMAVSLVMTVMAAQDSARDSVIDALDAPNQLEQEAPTIDADSLLPPTESDLLPPAEGDSAPLVPRAD
ncbi:MAG: preprotein translocase subunit SecG [Rhodobacteraceae bacterium]|nr:preprotein translocase subunit SecG [Paracoccaceae bacterium]